MLSTCVHGWKILGSPYVKEYRGSTGRVFNVNHVQAQCLSCNKVYERKHWYIKNNLSSCCQVCANKKQWNIDNKTNSVIKRTKLTLQDRYGLWTVLHVFKLRSRYGDSKRRTLLVKCRCACGKEHYHEVGTLKGNKTLGCKKCRQWVTRNKEAL